MFSLEARSRSAKNDIYKNQNARSELVLTKTNVRSILVTKGNTRGEGYRNGTDFKQVLRG